MVARQAIVLKEFGDVLQEESAKKLIFFRLMV